ncbi:MAG: putative toxin-antitoxin system toxin component, PIN family, partial [Zoogloeaceae bacterium]|nr:putative toxin-antitoxin system toxin component, PIN family [Zoogloeaceae bacterium]
MNDSQRWVVDTNVLISRLLAPNGLAAKAVDHALERGILLLSEDTLAELVAVLGRAKFDTYVSRSDRQRFIALLGGVARIVPVIQKIRACRDPKDDKFLDVALCGGARAIVTGDQD